MIKILRFPFFVIGAVLLFLAGIFLCIAGVNDLEDI